MNKPNTRKKELAMDLYFENKIEKVIEEINKVYPNEKLNSQVTNIIMHELRKIVIDFRNQAFDELYDTFDSHDVFPSNEVKNIIDIVMTNFTTKPLGCIYNVEEFKIIVRPAASMQSIDDAMEKVKGFDTPEELLEFIKKDFYYWWNDNSILTIKKHEYDRRINWDTYLICLDGKAILFSNGNIESSIFKEIKNENN